jgi:hypothetical protein
LWRGGIAMFTLVTLRGSVGVISRRTMRQSNARRSSIEPWLF